MCGVALILSYSGAIFQRRNPHLKFPTLKHAGLCNILIFLPALFLFFAIGFNIPLANWGTPKWVLALNFLLQEWKRSSLEYRTGRARSEWASMRSTAASSTGWLC